MTDNFVHKSYLIIDDFAEMRATIRVILRSLGVNQIDQARDGKDALAQMQKRRYDVVLCDYNLGPGKNGQQVLEEARHTQLIGIECIFIMITAESAREKVMSAIEYSPDSYLAKPFTKDLLRTRLLKLGERKAHLADVDQALMNKEYGLAIIELNALIATKPTNLSDLLKLKAETCLLAGRYDEAQTIYEQILAVREMPWARLGLGQTFCAKKQYAQAQEIFRQLIAADHNFILAHDWLAKTQIALKDFTEAEKTLNNAVRISPLGLRRQQQLGQVALSNHNLALAETAFESAVNLAEHSILNHPSLFVGLARSKSANGKHDEALKVIEGISKSFPEDRTTEFYQAAALAAVKKNQGDLQGARSALRVAEQAMSQIHRSTAAVLSVEMLKIYSQLGEKQKALDLLRTAVANNHDDEEFVLDAMRACREVGLDEAVETTIREVQQGVVKTNNSGVKLIKQGEFDAAIQLLRKAAEETPNNRTINLNVAKATIMKMERLGANADDVQIVRYYMERVQAIAADDWRLTDIIERLQKLQY